MECPCIVTLKKSPVKKAWLGWVGVFNVAAGIPNGDES